MRIEDLLEANKKNIIEKWFQQVAKTYAADTAHFLKNQKDPFANPVGSNIRSGLEALLDSLISGGDETSVKTFLDSIIRIRAVQTIFTPSQATHFIFDLKSIIRDVLKKELREIKTLHALQLFEDKIDRLGLVAFDVFMACREQIYDLKSRYEKSRVFRAFERAGLLAEIQED